MSSLSYSFGGPPHKAHRDNQIEQGYPVKYVYSYNFIAPV